MNFQNLQTTLPTVRMIVDVSKSAVVLSSLQVIKLLKSKEASNVVDIKVQIKTLFLKKTNINKLCLHFTVLATDNGHGRSEQEKNAGNLPRSYRRDACLLGLFSLDNRNASR